MNPRRLLSQAALLVGALAFSVGLQALAAFTGPSTAPPNADAYAPLTTGPTAQSKQGGLLLNTGGATNGLIVQSGNVGIGTASPSQQLDVAGYVKGSGLCIGSDCRTSWPATNSTETDPTVQSWAKASSPSIPGSVTVGGDLQVNGSANVNGTIRGATYGFGGTFATPGAGGIGSGCWVPNAITGDCSCPSGFSPGNGFPINGGLMWVCQK